MDRFQVRWRLVIIGLVALVPVAYGIAIAFTVLFSSDSEGLDWQRVNRLFPAAMVILLVNYPSAFFVLPQVFPQKHRKRKDKA